ncbi:hypothetical protein MASR2M117_22720 [Paludibacter sp.]
MHMEKNIVNGKSTESSVSVYFSKKNIEETISLQLTLGDSVYSLTKKVFVEDVPTRSMLIAKKDGKIMRKRMYDNGDESLVETGISSGSHPFNIQAHANYLYIFDAGTNVGSLISEVTGKSGDGNIRKIDLSTEAVTEIIHNRNTSAEHGFYNGYVTNSNIYWTDFGGVVYKNMNDNSVLGAFEWKGNLDEQTTVPYYLVKADRLGYYGHGLNSRQLNAGIYVYDNVYYWAKGGSGAGLYRFYSSDILDHNVAETDAVPELGSILKSYSIRTFKIDHVNQKIYFSVTAPAEAVGFWVANVSGTNPVRIDNAPMSTPVEYISSIAIDYIRDRVYWSYIASGNLNQDYFDLNPTHRSGVKYVQLSKSNYVDKDIQYFAPDISAYGIAIDEVKR